MKQLKERTQRLSLSRLTSGNTITIPTLLYTQILRLAKIIDLDKDVLT